MGKITNQQILDLKFGYSSLAINDEEDFPAFIDGIIADQTLILAGRIGSSAYADATAPTVSYAKRAELCLVAAELLQRRINVLIDNAQGNGNEIDVTHEAAQKKAYTNEANSWIGKIVAGATSDSNSVSSGVIETDHFTIPTS